MDGCRSLLSTPFGRWRDIECRRCSVREGAASEIIAVGGAVEDGAGDAVEEMKTYGNAVNCLDVGSNTTDGSVVLQRTLSNNNSQRWTLVSVGSGYYKVVDLATGKCLDTGGQTTNGSSMQQWYSNSSYNQQWTLIAQ